MFLTSAFADAPTFGDGNLVDALITVGFGSVVIMGITKSLVVVRHHSNSSTDSSSSHHRRRRRPLRHPRLNMPEIRPDQHIPLVARDRRHVRRRLRRLGPSLGRHARARRARLTRRPDRAAQGRFAHRSRARRRGFGGEWLARGRWFGVWGEDFDGWSCSGGCGGCGGEEFGY